MLDLEDDGCLVSSGEEGMALLPVKNICMNGDNTQSSSVREMEDSQEPPVKNLSHVCRNLHSISAVSTDMEALKSPPRPHQPIHPSFLPTHPSSPTVTLTPSSFTKSSTGLLVKSPPAPRVTFISASDPPVTPPQLQLPTEDEFLYQR